ncbi:MAG: T9SS type A sorting domain-containing protein, partial [Melioribacteraceae bacterium]|nr:T9SS type A sorting domain-containing protein [Melioribacteraceae bacterium]
VKSALWQIQIQPGSQTNTVTIEWDNSKLPDGTLVIKDVFGGSIVNVNMASTNMLEIPDASILNKLYLEYKMSTCISVALNSGWNLFSIPISGDEMNVDNLFTNSTSPVYKFENGYSVVSDVEVATGYWIRNAMAEDIEVCGSAVGSNEVPILEGWNLIGGYVGDNSVSAITTEPAGILNSPFWGFEGGYNNSSLIVEGKGYWIRSTQNGIIQLNGALAKSDNLSYNNSTIDKNWGRIAISDASGKSIVLYASEMPNNEKSFDLPPLPPREIFDVRFSNQSLVAGLNEGSEIISIQSMNYPVTVSVEGVDVYIKDLLGGKLINSEIKNAGELVLSNSSIDKLEIGLVKIPVRFELSQNYPNPFNPVTKIAYSIPNISEETVDVTLKIYDVLGNEVVRLVDTKQSAGNYEVEWQALNFVSGIYFYKLSAGKFVEIKKMILLK